MLRAYYYDLRLKFGIFTRSVRVQLLLNCHAVVVLRIRRPAYAAALPLPVYESSFWTSIEEYETSHTVRAAASIVGGEHRGSYASS